MDVAPSGSEPDMATFWQSRGGSVHFSPLWFSLSHSAPLGIDTLAHAWPRSSLCAFLLIRLIVNSEQNMGRLSVSSACDTTVALLSMFFSNLVSLLEASPWEIPVRDDLLTQMQGKIWHLYPGM